jgi:hypothetical protein
MMSFAASKFIGCCSPGASRRRRGARAETTIPSSGRPPDRVSADIHGEPLWPLLEDIAHQTGWHIFVEPGIDAEGLQSFQDLPSGDALKKLLGDLNFAFVPQTNGPDFLYVFTTTMRAATQRVALRRHEKGARTAHVANELLVKLKPGTDIDALAKSLGAKVTGRNDKLGIYRLQFADAAATDAALGKLKTIPTWPPWITITFTIRRRSAAIANAPVGPVSLTLNPPGDSGNPSSV